MQTITLRPRKIKSSLYKLHLKENITTSDFEKFEQNLKKLIIDIELVEQILENKKQNIDTSDLERKIDEMVYKLYDLTPEEITIIEGK